MPAVPLPLASTAHLGPASQVSPGPQLLQQREREREETEKPTQVPAAGNGNGPGMKVKLRLWAQPPGLAWVHTARAPTAEELHSQLLCSSREREDQAGVCSQRPERD